MPWTRRCSMGCESWPDEALYARCPICGEKTRRGPNGNPLSTEDAVRKLSFIEFETYYARYCALRGQPVDGPLYPNDDLSEEVPANDDLATSGPQS